MTVTDTYYRQKGIQQQNASLVCYANRYTNYRFIHADSDQHHVCRNMPNNFFKKHCVVLWYMITNPDADWMLFLDADVGVVNLARRIEDYLPAKDETDMHIIFYERFNGEIQSCCYLVRNHPWSHRFLARWLEWQPVISKIVYHNNDNGPLHLHILDNVEGISQKSRNQCRRAFELSTPFNDTYMKFVGCVRCALKGRWQFRHIRILRRGTAFSREPILGPYLIANYDFVIHGPKDNMTAFYKEYIDTHECRTNTSWQLPLRAENILYNMSEVRQRMAYIFNHTAIEYAFTIGVPETAHCWPHCSSVANKYWYQEFRPKICENATWNIL